MNSFELIGFVAVSFYSFLKAKCNILIHANGAYICRLFISFTCFFLVHFFLFLLFILHFSILIILNQRKINRTKHESSVNWNTFHSFISLLSNHYILCDYLIFNYTKTLIKNFNFRTFVEENKCNGTMADFMNV